MRTILLTTLAGMVLLAGQLASPCTTVVTFSGDSPLAANNLDCGNPFPRVWFVPGSEGRFGRFCFGTDANENIAEGGMNERGLYIAVNALDEDTGWQTNPDLPDWEQWEGWFESGVPDGILAMCSTVDEALEVFRSYNLFTLNRVKFLLADAGGASAIVEWTSDGLTVVPRGDVSHQISTNFVTSSFEPGQEPCYRYRTAKETLTAPDWTTSIASLRSLLSTVHLEFQTPTVLSTICNLETGEIHLYYFHDFERVRVFDLHTELEQQRHGYLLAELFKPKPYVAKVYEDFRRNAGG